MGDGNLVFNENRANRDFLIVNMLTTGTTSNRVVFPNGNVGIGKLVPTASLDVAGNTAISGHLSITSSSDQILIQSFDQTNKNWRLGTNIGGSGANRNFTIWETDKGNMMTFNHTTGNIGIGTVNPSAFLHVYGAGVGSGQSGIDLTNSVSPGHTFKLSAGIKNVSEGGFTIMDRTAGDVPRIVIDNAGNVGIGKSVPGASLDVAGNTIVGGRLTLNTTSDQLMMQSFDQSGKTWRLGTNIGSSGANRNFTIWESDMGNAVTISHPAGNVGIGTTTPGAAYKLDVLGNANISGEITVASIKTKVWTVAPDYVFEKKYRLAPLDHVERFVNENKHLPEIPSAKEMKSGGMDLAEMNLKLLKKVEELTLYSIQQNKKIQVLTSRMNRMEGK